MENKTVFGDKLAEESTENLMLISALAEPPYRHKALKELKKRRLLSCPEQFIDCFITNIGIVC